MTDREGKYNFYGIKPITHVLKLDKTTLPANAEMLLINNRQAGDPGSRFVDLKRGELHRADFAITDGMESCSQPLLDQIEERKKNIDSQLDALEQVLRADLSIDPVVNSISDLQAQPSSGCINSVGISANCNVEYKKDALREVKTVQIKPVKVPVILDLEQELQRSEPTQIRILNLKDQQVLPAAQTTIQLKGIYGTDIQLFVNDVKIDEKRIGKKAVSSDLGVAGFDFIKWSVKLCPLGQRYKQHDMKCRLIFQNQYF